MDRRNFLKFSLRSGIWISTVNLVACGKNAASLFPQESAEEVRAREGQTVTLYDTYAMALYMDGGLGPKTGTIKVDYILQAAPVTLEFWHGHGGQNHKFTILPEHYIQFKQKKKVLIETTSVASHTHKLFIDFSDPKWRVPGAQPVEVPIDTPVISLTT